ncbi:PAS domain-containing protein [Roseospira navarrensis]|nr:PAS domain-containing protein [Roseospira navarrensis]
MLDMQTLVLVAALPGLVLAWSMAMLRRRAPALPEAAWWQAAGLVISIGFVLIAVREALPALLGIVVPNSLFILGLAGLLAGLQVHQGRRPRWRLSGAVLAATVAGFVWYGLIAPDTAMRIIIVALAQTILCGAIVLELRPRARARSHPSAFDAMVGLPFLLHAVAMAARAVATALFDTRIDDFFSAQAIQTTAMLEVIVFLTLASVSLNTLIVGRAARRVDDVIWATRVGTWDWSVPADVVRINDRWAGMLGYTRAELEPITSRTWLDMVHPDDRPGLQRTLADHLERRASDYEAEARLRHKDGHWVWILHRGRVVEWTADGRPARMTGTHADVTERVTRATEIQAQRNLLANLAQQVPGVIYQFALKADGTMCFPFASEGIREIYGIAPDDVKTDATPAQDRIHPADVDRVIAEIEESARMLSPWRSEYRVVLPDRGVSWREGHAMP